MGSSSSTVGLLFVVGGKRVFFGTCVRDLKLDQDGTHG